MNIPADEDEMVSLGFLDELNHAFLFVRIIGPGFVAIILDSELSAGSNNTKIGWST